VLKKLEHRVISFNPIIKKVEHHVIIMPWYFICVILNIFWLLSACNQSPNSTVSHSTRKPSVHLVKTAIVRSQPLVTKSVYTGNVRAQRVVRIFTQESGRIIHLPYYEGDSVTTNDLLVQLDDALLTAELNKAIATYKYTHVNVQRYQRLAKKKIVSVDELSRAQTERDIARAEEHILRIRLSYTKIKAPFNAIVAERLAELGDVIQANTHILTLFDPALFVIDIELSALLLSQLQLKKEVWVQIDALGTTRFRGQISRLYPTINPRTRLGKIEVILFSLPKGLRAGQFCRVIIKNMRTPQLTIPYTALQHDRDNEYVFLVNVDNTVQRQNVVSGERLANKVEIIEGLKKDQPIIIKGFLGLRSGKAVQQVN